MNILTCENKMALKRAVGFLVIIGVKLVVYPCRFQPFLFPNHLIESCFCGLVDLMNCCRLTAFSCKLKDRKPSESMQLNARH